MSKRGVDNHVLRRHTEVGNDAKPFACDFEGCTAAFKFEEYLNGHKREVHIRKRVRIRNKATKEKKKWRLQHDIEEVEMEQEELSN